MPRSCETSRALIFLAIALLCTLPLPAQKAHETNRPKYDVSTEITIKGTVEEVKLPPKGSEKEIAHLLLKTGTDTVDVYLCPKSFLDDMGVSFSKGEEIAVTGSKVKQGEADLILAREVVKGTDTLVLRDAKGNPVWS
jgi:DNA/RNA endonuclease YhcR with UshA esterase domain